MLEYATVEVGRIRQKDRIHLHFSVLLSLTLLGTSLFGTHNLQLTDGVGVEDLATKNTFLLPQELQQTVLLSLDFGGTSPSSVEGIIQWNLTYGGSYYDVAKSVIQTSDDGFIFAGRTYSSTEGGEHNVWLVKTDAGGEVEWNQTYGGSGSFAVSSVIQTADGGYAFSGSTTSYRLKDAWLVKTDSDGTVEWTRTFGGSSSDWASTVIETTDGGFALAGWTYRGEGGDGWLIKTDVYGELQWTQTYGGFGDIIQSAIETTDGGFLLTGNKIPQGRIDPDGWLVKTDAGGEVEWARTYGGLNHDYAYSVIQTADGGFVFAGARSYGMPGDADAWLVKTDARGALEWNQTYDSSTHNEPYSVIQTFDMGGHGDDKAYSVIQTADGGFVFAGYTWFISVDHPDGWLVKTDARGNIEWMWTCDCTSRTLVYAVIQAADRGFALAGSIWSSEKKDDAWLVKIAPESPETTPFVSFVPELPTFIALAALVVLEVWKKRRLRD